MSELLNIQKICRRLKVLFAVFAVLCYALALLAGTAAVIRGVEGEAYIAAEGGFVARVAEALDFGGGTATLGLFIMDAVAFLALAVLLTVTVRCLRAEVKEGTPFTEKGAQRTKTLGLLYFFVALGTEMAAVILRESFSVAQAESLGVAGGMATGIALLIMSSMIRYGTRLQDMIMYNEVAVPDFEIIDAPPLEEPGAQAQEGTENVTAE